MIKDVMLLKDINKISKKYGDYFKSDTCFTTGESIVKLCRNDNKEIEQIMIHDSCSSRTYIMNKYIDDKFYLGNIYQYSFKFYHNNDAVCSEYSDLLKVHDTMCFINKNPIHTQADIFAIINRFFSNEKTRELLDNVDKLCEELIRKYENIVSVELLVRRRNFNKLKDFAINNNIDLSLLDNTADDFRITVGDSRYRIEISLEYKV